MGDVTGYVNVDEEIDRFHDWSIGLPNVDDITPLSQGLVPLELLSAFNIKPEPYRTSGDVNLASENTLSTIRGQSPSPSPNSKPSDENQEIADDEGADSKKSRRNTSPEEADSSPAVTLEGKNAKRSRLVWTPQLHKRFVDVVGHLGLKNAVPKTIMNLMNVEGLTRENVASHLQKYRLYLKRMHGVSFDSNPPASSSSPENVSMSYGGPVSMMGVTHGHMGVGNYNGFQSNHNDNNNSNNQFNGMMQSGNKYVTPGDR